MSLLFWIILILAVLPFIVALTGVGGIWKFLALLFCLGAISSQISPLGLLGSFGCWVVAWIFAGVARGAKR